MTAAREPGRVLRRALLAWGLGHLALGRAGLGRALLVAEVVTILLIAWLAAGLADTSAYLVPFLAGVAFLVVWAWQAVDAYRIARTSALTPDADTPQRSPAAAIGWLSLPLLAWAAGFWLVAADAATPAAVLDRFVSDWTAEQLDAGAAWPDDVVFEAEAAADALGSGPDRFRDVRVRIVDDDGSHASAIAEAIHYERQETRFLGVFTGTELVPVADVALLTIDLAARPADLPGGGSIGAVRWEVVAADRP